MSCLPRRRTWLPATLIGLLTGAALTTGCAGGSMPAPAAPARTPSPSVSIVSLSVTAEAVRSGGYVYGVVARLRETAGAAATIFSIDLTFMRESSVVASLHSDHPISDAANLCPANATVDSRELQVRDEDSSHPRATSVIAKVTFTDGASLTSSTTASADVPAPIVPPPTPAFTLSGVVSDESGGHAIAGATVQIVDGANAGRRSSTDGTGAYSIPGVEAGGVSLHAEASGYEATDQRVMVSQDTRLDLRLRTIRTAPPPSSPCSYTISPGSLATEWMGGSVAVTITRTSGSCSWQAASNATWISLTGSASGTDSATLRYLVTANGGVVGTVTRFGAITITWSGGSAQLSVRQGGANPEFCTFTVGINGQNRVTVPSAGGQLTATVTWVNTGIPPSVCTGTGFADGVFITLVPPNSTPLFGAGGGALTFSVSPNPSPGSARAGTVWVRTSTGQQITLTVSQQ